MTSDERSIYMQAVIYLKPMTDVVIFVLIYSLSLKACDYMRLAATTVLRVKIVNQIQTCFTLGLYFKNVAV